MFTEIECDTCKHLDTDVCFNCVHYEEREDLYEPADPATLRAREERRRAELEERLEYSFVQVDVIPEDFRVALREIKNKFSGLTTDHLLFVPVHAGENFLSASNGFVLAKLFCNVPEKLRGKNIIRLEQDSRARVYEKTLPWQGKEETIVCRKRQIIFFKLNVVELIAENKVELRFPNVRVLLNATFWSRAIDSLEEPITVYYGDRFNAVTLEGSNGFIVIMPLQS
ncbi:MAG: hypothetical protein K6U74_02950 [Firmicutes bacterium]|nr:hypothetical protein [Bacillota bacterium]